MRSFCLRISRQTPVGLILLAVAAFAGISAASATGAAPSNSRPAGSASPALSWPSQLARPAAFSCPHGETAIIPTAGWTDALGVSHLTYRSAPGLVSLLPPKGLTSSRVTPALLADLHIGVRGTGTSKASATSAVMRSFAGQAASLARIQQPAEFCRSKPDMSELPKLSSRNGALLNDRWYIPGGIWGGYAKTEAEYNNSINAAAGDWQVPPSLTLKEKPSVESTWVGVGAAGDNSDVNGLIQTGTSMMTCCAYQTWWEYIGSSGCVATLCGHYSSPNSVRPGDGIEASVMWESGNNACFFLTNVSTGTGSWDVCQAVNIPYDHTSAEWVDENHITSGDYYDDPGTVSWSGQIINSGLGESGSWVSPFTGSFLAIIMGNGTTASGTVECSDPNILSYPVNAATSAGEVSSQIITCKNSYDSP
jgi:hypothetical protein